MAKNDEREISAATAKATLTERTRGMDICLQDPDALCPHEPEPEAPGGWTKHSPSAPSAVHATLCRAESCTRKTSLEGSGVPTGATSLVKAPLMKAIPGLLGSMLAEKPSTSRSDSKAGRRRVMSASGS